MRIAHSLRWKDQNPVLDLLLPTSCVTTSSFRDSKYNTIKGGVCVCVCVCVCVFSSGQYNPELSYPLCYNSEYLLLIKIK